jgi:hypothetical protein
MCNECGCGIDSVGMGIGMSQVSIKDVSSDGNSGLNQEGSSGSLPISGADESDNLIVNM